MLNFKTVSVLIFTGFFASCAGPSEQKQERSEREESVELSGDFEWHTDDESLHLFGRKEDPKVAQARDLLSRVSETVLTMGQTQPVSAVGVIYTRSHEGKQITCSILEIHEYSGRRKNVIERHVPEDQPEACYARRTALNGISGAFVSVLSRYKDNIAFGVGAGLVSIQQEAAYICAGVAGAASVLGYQASGATGYCGQLY